MDYVAMNLQKSESEFQRRLEEARQADQIELAEQQQGLRKRKEYLDSKRGRGIFFNTNTDKVQKIKEWYPKAYRVLENFFPIFVERPDEMPSCVVGSANRLIVTYLKSDDRNLLAFH